MVKIIVLSMLGVVLMGIGIKNYRGDISSVHWYNRRHVEADDIPGYGKCIGTGTIIIGGSLLITAVMEALHRADVSDAFALGGCVMGLIIMLYGQFRYNKGIF